MPQVFHRFSSAAPLIVLLLAGCAQAPVQPSAPATDTAHAPVAASSTGTEATAQVMAAELAMQHGDAATAAADYAKAAAVSDDPAVAHHAAQLALGQGDIAGARQALARMQALQAPAVDVAGVQAQLALAQGHTDAARSALGRVLAGGDHDGWSVFAQVLAGARDPAAAGALLEALATPRTLPAGDVSTWLAISQLGEKIGRHNYARRIADAAARHFSSTRACRWAAHLALAAGDAKAARGWFERGLKIAPRNADLRLAYAAMLSKQGQPGQAAQVLAAGPPTLKIYRARAAFAAQANDQAALTKIFHDLQAAKPALRARAVFLRAQLADSLNRRAEARKLYAAVPADNPHAFDAAARRAVLLDAAGKTAAAHALAQRLVTDHANDTDRLRRAVQLDALIYRRHDDHAGAIAAFNRGLKQLPKDPDLLYGRAVNEADGGQPAAAIADLRQVLKLDPKNMQAVNALGYTLADANQDLDEAKKLLARALAAQPDEPAVIDSWGWLQYRLGHLDQAAKSLRKAWSKLKDPDIGTHLGEVLWVQGQHQDANAVFAAVRKLAPKSPALAAALKRLHK